MQTKSLFLAFGLCLLLLGSHEASAQVRVNIGLGYPAPGYYGPRYYGPPRPAVYAVPPPPQVIVAPYYAPRPIYYAPRPFYRGRGYYGRGRRW